MSAPSVERLQRFLREWGVGAHPHEWRLPPIETYPALVAWVKTTPGKWGLFAVFALLLVPHQGHWLEFTVAAALVSAAGPYRFHFAFAVAGALLLANPYWYGSRALDRFILEQEGLGWVDNRYLRAGTLALCIVLAAAAIGLARRFKHRRLARRPVLAEHVLCVILLITASSRWLSGLPQAVLWSVTVTLMAYFWYLAYALLDQRHRQPEPLFAQFATFHPFFAHNTTVPMGKSVANWRKVETTNDDELASCQLKAVKLLVWASVLKVVQWALRRISFDVIGIVPLASAFDTYLKQGVIPGTFPLLSIVVHFPDQLLDLAIWGHVAIAIGRLAGFRLLRNSCRPLRSRTVAEFWNRYFYYFKELLVTFYFYPTYVRWFKAHPRLRIVFATFMAAGVGNFFFHFMLQDELIVKLGPIETAGVMQTYAFYCFVLSAGIAVSQLRARRPDPNASWWRRQLVPSLVVATFYGFLSFFDGPDVYVPLVKHFDYLFRVLGVDSWLRAIG